MGPLEVRGGGVCESGQLGHGVSSHAGLDSLVEEGEYLWTYTVGRGDTEGGVDGEHAEVGERTRHLGGEEEEGDGMN